MAIICKGIEWFRCRCGLFRGPEKIFLASLQKHRIKPHAFLKNYSKPSPPLHRWPQLPQRCNVHGGHGSRLFRSGKCGGTREEPRCSPSPVGPTSGRGGRLNGYAGWVQAGPRGGGGIPPLLVGASSPQRARFRTRQRGVALGGKHGHHAISRAGVGLLASTYEEVPSGHRRPDDDQDHQLGVHEGKDRSSGDGQGSRRLEPQPQNKGRNQRSKNAGSQSASLGFLRRALGSAPMRSMTACSRVASGTCS